MSTNLRIDGGRLTSRLAELARIGAGDRKSVV